MLWNNCEIKPDKINVRYPLRAKTGGADRARTCDLLIANETLYQLSYDPIHVSRKQLRQKNRLMQLRSENSGQIGFHFLAVTMQLNPCWRMDTDVHGWENGFQPCKQVHQSMRLPGFAACPDPCRNHAFPRTNN